MGGLAEIASNSLREYLKPETQEQKNARIKEALLVAVSVYSILVSELGADTANHIWTEIAKKKRGRPRRPKSADNDSEMLRIYDSIVALFPQQSSRPRLKRQIAEHLSNKYGNRFGASVDAIIKHLNRLLHARERANNELLASLRTTFPGSLFGLPITTSAELPASKPPAKRGQKKALF